MEDRRESLLLSEQKGMQQIQATTDDTVTLPRLCLPAHPPQSSACHTPQTTLLRSALPPVSPAAQHGLQVEEIPTHPAVAGRGEAGRRPGRRAATAGASSRLCDVGTGWHTGITRRHLPNEDSVVFLQGICSYHGKFLPFSLFVVADGMGGHDGGQTASHLAMHSMMYTVLQSIASGSELSDEYLVDMLIGGVEWANLAVYQRGIEKNSDMGTTLTAALVLGSRAYLANVGDSRIYLLREGERLLQITRDHSLVAQLAAQGAITPDEIYTHPERHMITRCLGSNNTIEVDWFIAELLPRDRLLLCSDGLWEMVRDSDIERLLRFSPSPQDACDLLVQAALHGGGRDNVSVIVVQVP
ncbi:MAG: serine/threonine-protein phosphatase [Ktedonobacteraceae bacterium]|nr:serine/threonine-protein phosphatase [Ktedonobacteraceae bacterium]